MMSFSHSPIYTIGRQIRSSQACIKKGIHIRSLSSNDDINPDFVNRNPRNMEMLRLAWKPLGYKLESPTKYYWYRLMLEKAQKHTTAWVEHYSGVRVVSASTKEWAIKQHLISKSDANAVENIGRILAQRCLQSGITEMHCDLMSSTENSEKVKRFLNAIHEGGVHTEEPYYISARRTFRWARYIPPLPWHILEEEVLKEDNEKSK